MVDTPPSRSALDFLDAPERLSSSSTAGSYGCCWPRRVAGAADDRRLRLVTGALTKILGAPVPRDMQTFVAAFDTLFGGFRQRAQQTFALLQAPGTAFLVVAAPETDALREAAYFVERLGEDGCRWRAWSSTGPAPPHRVALGGRGDGAPRRGSRETDSRRPRLTAGLLRLHADRERMVEREAALRDPVRRGAPEVPTAVVPALAGDVHDLDGLRVRGAPGGSRTDRHAE